MPGEVSTMARRAAKAVHAARVQDDSSIDIDPEACCYPLVMPNRAMEHGQL